MILSEKTLLALGYKIIKIEDGRRFFHILFDPNGIELGPLGWLDIIKTRPQLWELKDD